MDQEKEFSEAIQSKIAEILQGNYKDLQLNSFHSDVDINLKRTS